MTGPGTSRSTSCRRRPTLRPVISPAPTTRSCRRATLISCRATGTPQSRRADRGTARRRAAAIARGERGDAGRHGIDHGAPPGAADDAIAARGRSGARGGRAPARVGFPDGCRQGRAAAVHRLAARLCPLGAVRQAGRCRRRYLGFAAAGHGNRLDPASRNGAPTRSIRDDTCEARLAAALEDALADCATATVRKWRNGNGAAPTSPRFSNQVLGRIPVFRDWVAVAVPTPGGYDTLNRGAEHDPRRRASRTSSASARVCGSSPIWPRPPTRTMIAVPGQSGNPLSPHFSDLLLRWREFRLAGPRPRRRGRTLILEPAR